MKLDQSNDYSQYRNSFWNEPWQIANAASKDAGFRDYLVSDYYPFAAALNNSVEYSIDYQWSSVPSRRYLHCVWVVIGVYLICIFGGKRLMRDRKPFDLKVILAAWNLLLAIFSLLGALRLVPHLMYVSYANDGVYFLCRAVSRAYADAPVFFWVVLFIYSKYAELLDTVFLVLRKRPISFLHWFHHATVTLYCWYSFAHQLSTGIWFAGMNYCVHAIMYFYYFLAAVGKPPNWSCAVTTLQLSQMVVGMVVNVAHLYYATRVQHCDISHSMVYAAFVMYACYAALFAQFFFERYFGKSKKSAAKPAAVNGHNGAQNGRNGTETIAPAGGAIPNGRANGSANGTHKKRN